jgi:hypothetical protein
VPSEKFGLVAIGVNGEGYREILGICEGAKEDKAGWSGFLKDLKERSFRTPVWGWPKAQPSSFLMPPGKGVSYTGTQHFQPRSLDQGA